MQINCILHQPGGISGGLSEIRIAILFTSRNQPDTQFASLSVLAFDDSTRFIPLQINYLS